MADPRMRRGLRAIALFGVALCASAILFVVLREQQDLLDDLSFSLGTREWKLTESRSLLVLSLVPLLLLGVFHSRADLPWQQRVLSFFLRAGFFAALAFSLGRPQEEEKVRRVCTVALVDVSTSVAKAGLERFRTKLSELAESKGEDDELRLLAFAERAREIPLETKTDGSIIVPDLEQLRAADPGGATDVEGALELAAAWTRSDCVSRYVLFSDGIETRGSALSAIAQARDAGVRLFTEPLSERPPADVAVVGLEIPEGVRTGEPFEVRVKLNSTQASQGQLRLYQGATLNGLGGAREVELTAGESSQVFESVVRVPGDVTYRVEYVPASEDVFSQNNGYEASIEVPGPPRVLIVDRKPEQASYLAQALVAQQLDVDVRAPQSMPQSTSELGQFQFVILSDLAYSDVSRGAEALLERYVRSGGGLLFAGGEAGFGPGGWDRSSLKKILPVTMDSKKEREVPGVAMALVIDRSGSMTGLPMQMAKEACTATLGVLQGTDLIEVIAFDSQPTRYVKMQPARYRARIESSVARIQPGGGTEIFNSLDMAYQDLAAVEARRKHIILLTDGNAGSDGLYELASAAFAEGITVTAVGLGSGVNRALLSMISETGGGRFHAAEDPSRLPRIFTRETELISKKTTLDDWFPVSVARSAEFLKGVGIGAAPYLRGYTSTQLSGPPSEAILLSDRGEPILARKPVGLGWTLAWTSDLKARWATDWLKWGRFGVLMAQMVREHQRTDDTEIRPMKVELIGDQAVASFEAFDELENFDNTLSSRLDVRRLGASPGDETSREVSFRRVAPGLYEARATLSEYGSYALKASHGRFTGAGEIRPAGVSHASLSRPYPEEFRDLEPRTASLGTWAELSGGEPKASPNVWRAGEDSVTARIGRQNDFIYMAILLFFLDLLVRRVRIFDRQFKASSAPKRMTQLSQI